MQAQASEEVVRLSVALIDASPFQARQAFDEAELLELGETIVKHGLLQPITVRPKGDGRFELVAGERRLRAVRLKGLPDIAAFVRTYTDQEAVVVCSLENLQRRDLNPVERGRQVQAMLEQGIALEEISQRVGKPKRTLQEWLDVLGMPLVVQQLLTERKLAQTHLNVIQRLERPADQAAAATMASVAGLTHHELKARTQHKPQREPQRQRARTVSLEQVSRAIVMLSSQLQLLEWPDSPAPKKVQGVTLQIDTLINELSRLRTKLNPPLLLVASS